MSQEELEPQKPEQQDVSFEDGRSVGSSRYPNGTQNSLKGGKRVRVSKSLEEIDYFEADDEEQNDRHNLQASDSYNKHSRSIGFEQKRPAAFQDEDFVDDSDGEPAPQEDPFFGFQGPDGALASGPFTPKRMGTAEGFSAMANQSVANDNGPGKHRIKYSRSESSNDVADLPADRRDNQFESGQKRSATGDYFREPQYQVQCALLQNIGGEMNGFDEEDKQDDLETRNVANPENGKMKLNWLKQRMRRVQRVFSRVFYKFPETRPSLEEYYLAKVSSMYSSNFVISVVIYIAVRVFGSLMTIRMQTKDVANLVFWSSEIVIIMGLSILVSKKLIVRKPEMAKKVMLAVIYVEFITHSVRLYYENEQMNLEK